MPSNSSAFIYYKLVYDYLSDRIREFGLDLMHQMMLWVSAVALVLVTLWILIQGYRFMTGQARESLMGTVTHMTRIVIIVTAASTTGVFGTDLHAFFTDQMSTAINQLMTGSNDTPAETIDKNLAYTQLALSTIDAVKIDTGDTELGNDKARAELLAAFGSALVGALPAPGSVCGNGTCASLGASLQRFSGGASSACSACKVKARAGGTLD